MFLSVVTLLVGEKLCRVI